MKRAEGVMIGRVTPPPGGPRSPSTKTPPAAPPSSSPSRDRRVPPVRLRALAISILRWAVLFGGLVIIADLATLAMIQRTFSPDDQMAIAEADEIINWVLFSVLGIVVVRETRLFYAGVLAGLVGALVDSAVVAAAQVMAPMGGAQVTVLDVVERNLIIGIAFAGMSGIVYALVQRSAGGGPRHR